MADESGRDGVLDFAKRILAFFNHPAVYVLTLIAVGIVMLIAAALLESTFDRTAKVLNLGGATILGAGVFTAVTKAFLYGGVFRSAVIDALRSDEFKDVLVSAGRQGGSARPVIESFDRQFDQAVDALVRSRPVLESLDIMAHTSSKYFAALRNRSIRVKRVRLLLLGDRGLTVAVTPGTNEDKESVRQEVQITANKWLATRDQGLFEQVDIRTCDFAPTLHFMVIDRSEAQFGLFQWIDRAPGVTTLASFVVRQDAAGRQLVANLQSTFDDIFENRSQPWPH